MYFSADGCVLSLGTSVSVVCAWPDCGKVGKKLCWWFVELMWCVCANVQLYVLQSVYELSA